MSGCALSCPLNSTPFCYSRDICFPMDHLPQILYRLNFSYRESSRCSAQKNCILPTYLHQVPNCPRTVWQLSPSCKKKGSNIPSPGCRVQRQDPFSPIPGLSACSHWKSQATPTFPWVPPVTMSCEDLVATEQPLLSQGSHIKAWQFHVICMWWVQKIELHFQQHLYLCLISA